MFIPSDIKDELYELADNYCCGSNMYRFDIIQAIAEFFDNKHPNIQVDWYDYSFDDIGVFYVAWIEDGNLHAEAFKWRL